MPDLPGLHGSSAARVPIACVVVLAVGFVLALVLAWYHGERGAERISGPELLLIALVLAIGGGWSWRFGQGESMATTRHAVATARSPDAAKRKRDAIPVSVAGTTAPGLRVPGARAAPPIPARSIADPANVPAGGPAQAS